MTEGPEHMRPDDDWRDCLSRRSGSFGPASLLIPSDLRDEVRAVYAFCRATDDIADAEDGRSVDRRRTELDAWVSRARSSYRGESPPGESPPLLRVAMASAARRGVPFRYVEELVEGMRMDLRGTEYETVADLERYAYRVAAVVGLWMVRLWGFRDPWLLARAADLGIGMQLTNIARDVAEDWERGRLYLPSALLRRHGLETADVGEMASGRRPVDARYRSALDELLAAADRRYEAARPGILELPGPLRRPTAVAARVYRGVQPLLRSDPNRGLREPRRTGVLRKGGLTAAAVLSADLGSVRRRHRRHWGQLYGWASRAVGQVSA